MDKIALAHHLYDQAETVLLNIIRGAGLAGARGMEPVRDGIYIRPLLNTPREEIMSYLDEFGLEYVEDETNKDNTYARNYIRNVVMPTLRRQFRQVDRSLVKFADICAKDDDFINKQFDLHSVIEGKDFVKVPLSFFYQDEVIVNRILMRVFKRFALQDIESKHINMVRQFALEANNGSIINLPFKLKVAKEYDYITIGAIKKIVNFGEYPFKSGKLNIDNYGTIRSTASKVKTEPKPHQHIVDAAAIPDNAIWRFRQEGDVFTPLNMKGSKKLKDYFIDKKIPQRMRDTIPVLASGNNILAIADVEIADSIKVTDSTTQFYKINYEKDLI